MEQEDRILTALENARTARVRPDGLLELRDGAGAGRSDRQVYYGGAGSGDVALACDWDGDGQDGIAVIASEQGGSQNALAQGRADVVTWSRASGAYAGITEAVLDAQARMATDRKDAA